MVEAVIFALLRFPVPAPSQAWLVVLYHVVPEGSRTATLPPNWPCEKPNKEANKKTIVKIIKKQKWF